MVGILRRLWFEDNGQDIAEYAVMLAVILVIVVGTILPDWFQRQQRVLCRCELEERSTISPHSLRMQGCPPKTRILRDLVPEFS